VPTEKAKADKLKIERDLSEDEEESTEETGNQEEDQKDLEDVHNGLKVIL